MAYYYFTNAADGLYRQTSSKDNTWETLGNWLSTSTPLNNINYLTFLNNYLVRTPTFAILTSPNQLPGPNDNVTIIAPLLAFTGNKTISTLNVNPNLLNNSQFTQFNYIDFTNTNGVNAGTIYTNGATFLDSSFFNTSLSSSGNVYFSIDSNYYGGNHQTIIAGNISAPLVNVNVPSFAVYYNLYPPYTVGAYNTGYQDLSVNGSLNLQNYSFICGSITATGPIYLNNNSFISGLYSKNQNITNSSLLPIYYNGNSNNYAQYTSYVTGSCWFFGQSFNNGIAQYGVLPSSNTSPYLYNGYYTNFALVCGTDVNNTQDLTATNRWFNVLTPNIYNTQFNPITSLTINAPTNSQTVSSVCFGDSDRFSYIPSILYSYNIPSLTSGYYLPSISAYYFRSYASNSSYVAASAFFFDNSYNSSPSYITNNYSVFNYSNTLNTNSIGILSGNIAGFYNNSFNVGRIYSNSVYYYNSAYNNGIASNGNNLSPLSAYFYNNSYNLGTVDIGILSSSNTNVFSGYNNIFNNGNYNYYLFFQNFTSQQLNLSSIKFFANSPLFLNSNYIPITSISLSGTSQYLLSSPINSLSSYYFYNSSYIVNTGYAYGSAYFYNNSYNLGTASISIIDTLNSSPSSFYGTNTIFTIYKPTNIQSLSCGRLSFYLNTPLLLNSSNQNITSVSLSSNAKYGSTYLPSVSAIYFYQTSNLLSTGYISTSAIFNDYSYMADGSIVNNVYFNSKDQTALYQGSANKVVFSNLNTTGQTLTLSAQNWALSANSYLNSNNQTITSIWFKNASILGGQYSDNYNTILQSNFLSAAFFDVSFNAGSINFPATASYFNTSYNNGFTNTAYFNDISYNTANGIVNSAIFNSYSDQLYQGTVYNAQFIANASNQTLTLTGKQILSIPYSIYLDPNNKLINSIILKNNSSLGLSALSAVQTQQTLSPQFSSAIFYDNSYNSTIINNLSTATFYNSSLNFGNILSGYFYDNSANTLTYSYITTTVKLSNSITNKSTTNFNLITASYFGTVSTAYFYGSSYNNGIIANSAFFYNSAFNISYINNKFISNSVTNTPPTLSTLNTNLLAVTSYIPTAYFYNSSKNYGNVTNAYFTDNSLNNQYNFYYNLASDLSAGGVFPNNFLSNGNNTGNYFLLVNNANFNLNSINNSTVNNVTFNDNSVNNNNGYVKQTCNFTGNTNNIGKIYAPIINFNLNSLNSGTIYSQIINFNNNSYNNSNSVTATLSCNFNDSSYNLGTIYGNTYFTGYNNNIYQTGKFINGNIQYKNSQAINQILTLTGNNIFSNILINGNYKDSNNSVITKLIFKNNSISNLPKNNIIVNNQILSATFYDSSYNNSIFNFPVTFNDNSYNVGTINNSAYFLGNPDYVFSKSNSGTVNNAFFSSVITGNNYQNINLSGTEIYNLNVINQHYNATNLLPITSITFRNSSIFNNFYNNPTNNSYLNTFYFYNSSKNNAKINYGLGYFYNSSVNTGSLQSAIFNNNSINLSSISLSGIFNNYAINAGYVGFLNLNDQAFNKAAYYGTINYNSLNKGLYNSYILNLIENYNSNLISTVSSVPTYLTGISSINSTSILAPLIWFDFPNNYISSNYIWQPYYINRNFNVQLLINNNFSNYKNYLNFNGNNYLNIPTDINPYTGNPKFSYPTGNNARTFSITFSSNQINSKGILLGTGSSNINFGMFSMYIDTTTNPPSIGVDTNGGTVSTTNWLGNGNWTIFTVVYNQDECMTTARLYLNGYLINTNKTGNVTNALNTIMQNTTGTYEAVIGGLPSNPTQNKFNGNISGFSIYNRALSPLEVYNNYLYYKNKHSI